MKLKLKFYLPLIPTVSTVFIVLTLIGLGSWQLMRLKWKTEMLSQIYANTNLPPIDMDQVLNDIHPEKWEYRRVILKGRFLHDLEVNLVPRSLNGQPGYHLITPFQLESGETLLINRGWAGSRDPYESIERADKPTELIATIATFPKPGFFTPKNNFEKKEIFYIDLNAFAKNTSLVTLLPFYGIQEPKDTESALLPKPVGISLNIPNNHLAYAITWFSLAIVALIIYSIFVYQWNHRLRTLYES